MTSFVWCRVAGNPWFFATLIFNNFQLFYGVGYFSCNILIFMYLFCVLCPDAYSPKSLQNHCRKKPWIPCNPTPYKRCHDLNGLSDGDFSSIHKSTPGSHFFLYPVIGGQFLVLSSSCPVFKSCHLRAPPEIQGVEVIVILWRINISYNDYTSYSMPFDCFRFDYFTKIVNHRNAIYLPL